MLRTRWACSPHLLNYHRLLARTHTRNARARAVVTLRYHQSKYLVQFEKSVPIGYLVVMNFIFIANGNF